MRVRVAPQAAAELDAIWLYMARERGDASADRVIDSITAKFDLVARFPLIGRSLAAEGRPAVRYFPAGKYLIFYDKLRGTVRIRHVLHASRDAFALFLEGEG